MAILLIQEIGHGTRTPKLTEIVLSEQEHADLQVLAQSRSLSHSTCAARKSS
jgi:hypothetical protein